MNPSLGSSPTSASVVTIHIPERGNSHRMQPIQTKETFTTTTYASNSRSTSVQPPVVKEETTNVSIPISMERQENGRAKSVIKIAQCRAIPTSQASVSDKANPSESRVKISTNLSMAEFHASKTCCNSERENLTLPSPKAAISDIAVAKVESKKESTHIPMPDQCTLNRMETEGVSSNEESKPLMIASQRITSQPSPSRKSMKTKSATRRNQQTSENAPKDRKRPAEKALPFIAKVTRVNAQDFTAARSIPMASVARYTAPPQTSESRGLQSKQNEKSIAARPLPQRHSKVASSTSQGYQKATSSTEASDFPMTTSSMPPRTPVTSIHARKGEQTMMVASSQIRAGQLPLSPKSRSLVTSTAGPAMQKSIAANPVSKQRITSQSHALLTNADRRGLPKAAPVAPQASLMTTTVALHCPGINSNAPDDPPVMHAVFQASPTVTITPPVKETLVKPNNADKNPFAENRLEDNNLPGLGTSASHSGSLKICSVRQHAPVSSSSISDILESIQTDANFQRTNEQNKAATMVQRHAAKDMASKTTHSTSLITTTRNVTVSARKPAVGDGSANVRSDQNVSVIPAKVQEHVIMRPPDVEVKQENTPVFQPSVTHNLPGNFLKCENQNLTMITQRSSGLLRAGSHAKQLSVNSPYMKRTGATILENRIETSNGKSASVVETEPISPTFLNKGSTKTQATRGISHHSIIDQRTRPMKPKSIVKEEPFLPISGIDKAMTPIGVGLAPRTQPGRLSDLPKAENRCGTNQHSEKRKMASLVGEENANVAAGRSAQLIAPAARHEPMLQSAVFQPHDGPESTKPCKMRSRRGRKDTSTGVEQNGSGIIAHMTGSHYATPHRIAKKRVKKKYPGNRASCPTATDDKTQPLSSSSAGDFRGHTEGLMVVELPYGRTRTIALKEDDMERHIPVWNTKLKYKVAGTAAPLGKNIARYLDRKKGEFEVYDEQEKYEPEHTRKGARVTIWHKIEKRKISGTSAPLRKNIERYLRAHPHCEEYVDQQSKLDPTEKKNANVRVTVWNKEIGRKQGFGQSGPLRKNLERYLLRHPHLEEYNGQDIVTSGGNPEERVQNGEVTEKEEHHQSSQVHHGNSQDVVDPENREGETQNANVSEGYDCENLVDVDAKLERQLLDPSEELDEARIFEDCNSADPVDACFPLDMSNIPDLDTFPFQVENVDVDQFELDPDSFFPPRHVRQLENVSDICVEESIPETEREIHFQDAVDDDVDNDFIGEVVPDQMDIEASIGGDSELLPVELQSLDSLHLFPDLELDGVFRPEDLSTPLD